ncbi:inositol monophosphatase family protein [Nocardia sp. NBC_00565]|uniref:inositol monophosphatase family protein n=1 Tax=Nocardia sp. NBC_00565 TaxID=2975993 RepID=UPI002E8064EC|nr:inositol monophosphatase family protein [Nocardia sp. NBC_00565]WUB99896.1 inositol monophosphatase family protein [Nocardia sp. NBC_00565]
MSDVGSLWEALDEQLLPLLRRYRRNLASLQVDRKADNTLLSEADLATQTIIIETISRYFPGSRFVAEEDEAELPSSGEPTWIVDPIDGTSQFVSADGREFCSVVCLLDAGVPVAAYVLAPELGADRTPISIHWSGEVTANGQPAKQLAQSGRPRRASVTRSKDSAARKFETDLAEIGCVMKIRTTSQTLDMVRACIDLSAWTQAAEHQYDLFYRPDQKVWDGAAGIGLAIAMGRAATDGRGISPLPLGEQFLSQREPTFAETIAGDPDCVRWFVELLAEYRSG